MTDIILTQRFQHRLKQLAKKYRNIKKDISPVIEKLSQGQIIGKRLQRQENEIYKVRVQNRDANRGKSGGYRVIYYVYTEDTIVLLSIYSKSSHDDIETKEIEEALSELQ